MKIQPTGNRLLVKVISRESYKGVMLPSTVTIQGSASVGEIIGTGPGYLSDKKTDKGKSIYDPMEMKIGEQIVFNTRAGLILSKKYRLIREDEVIAKVDKSGVDIGDELFSED